MAKHYETYGDLVDEIMWSIADAVPGSDIGVSSKSISRYVEVNVEDEDGDILDTRRIRISDHDATASCVGNIVHEVDIRKLDIREETDDCGEFEGIWVANNWLIDEMVDDAILALTE